MNLLFCILFMGSSVHCSKKIYPACPPLYIKDIYTDGKPDKGRDQLLVNLQKTFPVLTIDEIDQCINRCKDNQEADIVQECQDFMLNKLL